jgi:predicted dehydrogenase
MAAQAAARPRLGFLGLGWIGCHRLDAVVRAGTADVVGLSDASREACDRARSIAPLAEVVPDLGALLSLGLDGVVIATPSALHAAQSIESLERGVAVFAQKPLARTAAETAAVLDAARRRNRLLAVDLSYRHTRAIEAVADQIRSGSLGDIYAAELVFHNAYGPDRAWFYDRALSGGGCLMDLGTHLIDLALWMDGRRVTRVDSRLFAGGRRLAGTPSVTEDFALLSMDVDGGATVQIACSWKLPAGRDAVIEARWFGTRGGVRMANVSGSFYDFVAERFDGTVTATLVSPPDDWGGRAILAWVDRLTNTPAYDAAAEELLNVAEVLDRAYGVTCRTDEPARLAPPQPHLDEASPGASARGRRAAAPGAAAAS